MTKLMSDDPYKAPEVQNEEPERSLFSRLDAWYESIATPFGLTVFGILILVMIVRALIK